MAYETSEEVRIFSHDEDGSVTIYERSGYCCRCGECCVGDPFDGEEGEPAVEGYCPLFRMQGLLGSCSNREHPYYLSGCNVWPSHPNQIEDKPSCTYKFKVVS